jgi:hypothetical protein
VIALSTCVFPFTFPVLIRVVLTAICEGFSSFYNCHDSSSRDVLYCRLQTLHTLFLQVLGHLTVDPVESVDELQ